MWQILSLGNVLLRMSPGSAEQLKALGFSADRIVQTPYSVDDTWWTKRAAEADLDAVRAKWRIPATASVVLFCAKLQPWKGPPDLLEAFYRARSAYSIGTHS